MTDVLVDRLRIRGAAGRRLAGIAARLLPAALDDALADVDDVRLGRITVRLDLDPADYDDATVATLWADRIRSAAVAAGARTRPTGAVPDPGVDAGRGDDSAARVTGSPAAGSAEAGAGRLAATVVVWLRAGAPADAVPVALAAVADPDQARAVVARLGAADVAALVAALRGPRAAVGRGPAQDAAGAGTAPAPPRPGRRPATEDDPAWPPPSGVPSPPERGARAAADRVAAAEVVARTAATFAPLLDLAARTRGSATVDLAAATRAAGLVLLYPWLADLCRDATTLHPLDDPVAVRRSTLALLADPDDATLAVDPLVVFLAGGRDAVPVDLPADLPRDVDAPPRLAEHDAVVVHAESVLARFAALLPGFGASSPGFVRESWVRRPGLLDTDPDPAALVAATMPLDVLLPFLPYPVTLLRLPWTAALTVRFVP